MGTLVIQDCASMAMQGRQECCVVTALQQLFVHTEQWHLELFLHCSSYLCVLGNGCRNNFYK